MFIGLLNGEGDKYGDCRAVWDEAEQGKTEIITSVFTFAEVVRARCEGKVKPLPEADDKPIADLLSQKWIIRMLLDESIAVYARRLLRAHTECHKPSDAIHLATALQHNVEEMHTFDGSDLLKLSGKVQKRDGKPLTICKPNAVAPAPLPKGRAEELALDFGEPGA